MTLPQTATATEIAGAVRQRQVTARSVLESCLSTINRRNTTLNAFSSILAQRARDRADVIDAEIAKGQDPGPLAGVPFAVKNLFDIAGIVTLAGSRINRDHAPALRDAALIRRLEAAGAILIGALTMGEYAYDFTGENAHYGPSRNPHAPDHMSGGSSGGSGTAVAAGMVPLALGSDTNGSIRVPSSFCGRFGLKPTYGGLSRAGTINGPATLADVGAAFVRYETALVGNDVAKLDELFWHDERTIRYGAAEHLYGIEAILDFRLGRSPVNLARDPAHTVITTFGRDCATASTLFHRSSAPGKVGRQMQTWVRMTDGWRVVAAHVSVIEEPAP